MKLNLGCGRDKLSDYVNVDLVSVDPDVVWDLEDYPWPFDDNTAEEVILKHVVEHIRDLIPFMNELWRVCSPGAIVKIECPYYTHHRAVMDPTHVRYICESSFHYFNQSWLKWVGIEHYGVKADFEIERSTYRYEEDWERRTDREDARLHQWNVVKDIMFRLIALK